MVYLIENDRKKVMTHLIEQGQFKQMLINFNYIGLQFRYNNSDIMMYTEIGTEKNKIEIQANEEELARENIANLEKMTGIQLKEIK